MCQERVTLMSQIDAFPEIPSKKKPEKDKIDALTKIKAQLGQFGYLEEVENPEFKYTKKNWIAVGVCEKTFPYKKKEYGRGPSVDAALEKSRVYFDK